MITKCYYCDAPEGAKHHPECPEASRISGESERRADRVRDFIDEAIATTFAEAQRVAGDGKTDFIVQDGVVYDFPKVRGMIGKFIEAQATPAPPGALRPPTRDEVTAFERFQKPFWWLAVPLLVFAALATAGCQQVNWNPDPPWDHAPITVDWTSDLGDVMPWAMDSWNHAAGCTVLVRAHGAPDVTVGPYDGTACGRDANLEATGDAVAGTWRCSPTHGEVRFAVLSDIRSNGIVASHEMGHVLGLAHDRSALMQAAPDLYHPERLGGGGDSIIPWPSDADGAAVGKRYCR